MDQVTPPLKATQMSQHTQPALLIAQILPGRRLAPPQLHSPPSTSHCSLHPQAGPWEKPVPQCFLQRQRVQLCTARWPSVIAGYEHVTCSQGDYRVESANHLILSNIRGHSGLQTAATGHGSMGIPLLTLPLLQIQNLAQCLCRGSLCKLSVWCHGLISSPTSKKRHEASASHRLLHWPLLHTTKPRAAQQRDLPCHWYQPKLHTKWTLKTFN